MWACLFVVSTGYVRRRKQHAKHLSFAWKAADCQRVIRPRKAHKDRGDSEESEEVGHEYRNEKARSLRAASAGARCWRAIRFEQRIDQKSLASATSRDGLEIIQWQPYALWPSETTSTICDSMRVIFRGKTVCKLSTPPCPPHGLARPPPSFSLPSYLNCCQPTWQS